MSTPISPLRQRMIEDMQARKLNPHTQRSHIYPRTSSWTRARMVRIGQFQGHEPGKCLDDASPCG